MLLAGDISTLRAKAGTWKCEYILASWLQANGQNLECEGFSGAFPFGNNSGGFQEPRNQVPLPLSLSSHQARVGLAVSEPSEGDTSYTLLSCSPTAAQTQVGLARSL